MTRLVIVGGSAAGSRATASALRTGFEGTIHVVSREPEAPFYRPALSKQMLSGAWSPGRAAQSPPVGKNVRWHTGRSAINLDIPSRSLFLDDGGHLEFDYLVLAGGCRPRVLPGVRGAANANSVEDVLRLRQVVRKDRHVVIIGAGLVGSEVAATLCAAGTRVTVVDPSPAPLARALGPLANDLCVAQHRAHGVDLRLGVQVVRDVKRDRDGVHVETDIGMTITADEAVVCVGVRPDTQWLYGSGAPLLPDGSIACDEYLMVEGQEGISAAGDIAAWRSVRMGRRVRVEHWMTAIEQGSVAGRNVLLPSEDRSTFDGIPMFWSEQHGKLIHVLGYHEPDSEWSIVEGTFGQDGLVAAASRSGRTTGYLLFNAPRRIGQYRQRLLTRDFSVQGAS